MNENMWQSPLSLRSFPRAIVHIDADAFFVSCEQALNPKLKGKPVVTGKERGIASAVSYEAKALGIKRGMNIREVKKICPDIIHLPSDYETYSLFSNRMFEIVRRYTSVVEEYSIDECFAEITGLRRPMRMSYEKIIANIKSDLDKELGMTFSIGLGPSKVVAKLASKYDKPSGCVSVPANKLHLFLKDISVGDVWGIGEQTTAYLASLGVRTALEFAQKDENWIKEKMIKPHRELWSELRGISVLEIETKVKDSYQSISKTKTFTPATGDRAFIFAQLSKNTENACIKARRHGLVANRVFFLLRTQEYRHFGLELKLSHPTANPNEIVSLIDKHLDKIVKSGNVYRLTGIVLSHLTMKGTSQVDLFGEVLRVDEISRVYDAMDQIDSKFGKHTIFLGSSMGAINGRQHSSERAETAWRKDNIFKGENKRQRVGVPMLGDVI